MISGSVNDWSSNFRRKGCGRAMSGGGGGWGGGSSSMHMYYSKVFMYPVHVPSDEMLWTKMLPKTSILFSFVHETLLRIDSHMVFNEKNQSYMQLGKERYILVQWLHVKKK